jgi:hypothetical protein
MAAISIPMSGMVPLTKLIARGEATPVLERAQRSIPPGVELLLTEKSFCARKPNMSKPPIRPVLPECKRCGMEIGRRRNLHIFADRGGGLSYSL